MSSHELLMSELSSKTDEKTIFSNQLVDRRKNMDKKNEVRGKFRYKQDSKRYHRFQIETESGIVGLMSFIVKAE